MPLLSSSVTTKVLFLLILLSATFYECGSKTLPAENHEIKQYIIRSPKEIVLERQIIDNNIIVKRQTRPSLGSKPLLYDIEGSSLFENKEYEDQERLLVRENLKERFDHSIVNRNKVSINTGPKPQPHDGGESEEEKKVNQRETILIVRENVKERLHHNISKRQAASQRQTIEGDSTELLLEETTSVEGVGKKRASSLEHYTEHDIVRAGPAAITFTILGLLALFCVVVGTILYYWQIVHLESTYRLCGL